MGLQLPRFASPQSQQDTLAYIQQQLTVIEQTLNEGQDEIKFKVRTVAPPKPRVGLLAYADGTLWNPGSGEGVYAYKSDGQWHFLG